MSDTARIEEIAARWLLHQSDGGWSAANQSELDAWLDQSVTHKVAYWRLEMGWSAVDRMAALRAPTSPVSVANDRFPARRWWPAAIAAVVVLGLAPLGWRATHPNSEKPIAYATAIGGHENVPLADGTRLELNTQTRLRASIADNRRQVWLDRGEAYFEVAHDAHRPFLVHAGPKLVTVLGTKFSVRRDGDRVEVAVVEGRVRIEDVSPNAALVTPIPVLTRGEMIVAQGTSTMLAPRSIDAVDDDLAWRGGMLSFDQATLGDAVDEFNRYNRRQLTVVGAARSMRIGGSFEARNIDVFARLLQRTYGLKIDDRGDTITISQ